MLPTELFFSVIFVLECWRGISCRARPCSSVSLPPSLSLSIPPSLPLKILATSIQCQRCCTIFQAAIKAVLFSSCCKLSVSLIKLYCGELVALHTYTPQFCCAFHQNWPRDWKGPWTHVRWTLTGITITNRGKSGHLNFSEFCTSLLSHFLSLGSATIFAVTWLAVRGSSPYFLHRSVDKNVIKSYIYSVM